MNYQLVALLILLDTLVGAIYLGCPVTPPVISGAIPYDACVPNNITCSNVAPLLQIPSLTGVFWDDPPGGGSWNTPGIRNATLTSSTGVVIGWFAFLLSRVPMSYATYVSHWISSVPIDAVILKGQSIGVAWVYHPTNPRSSNVSIYAPISLNGKASCISEMSVCWSDRLSLSVIQFAATPTTGNRTINYNWAVSNNHGAGTPCQNIQADNATVPLTATVTLDYNLNSDLWSIRGTVFFFNPDPANSAIIRDVMFRFPAENGNPLYAINDNCSSIIIPPSPSATIYCSFWGTFPEKPIEPLLTEIVMEPSSQVLGVNITMPAISWELVQRDVFVNTTLKFNDLPVQSKGSFSVGDYIFANETVSTTGSFQIPIERTVSINCGHVNNYSAVFSAIAGPTPPNTSPEVSQTTMAWCVNVTCSCPSSQVELSVQAVWSRYIAYNWSVTSNRTDLPCVDVNANNVTVSVVAGYTIGYRLVDDAWTIKATASIRNPDLSNPALIGSVQAFFQSRMNDPNYAINVVCNNNGIQSLPPGQTAMCTLTGSFPQNPQESLTVRVVMLPGSCVNGSSSISPQNWTQLIRRDNCVAATSQFSDEPIIQQGTICTGNFTSPLDNIPAQGSFARTTARTKILTCRSQPYIFTETFEIRTLGASPVVHTETSAWCYRVSCNCGVNAIQITDAKATGNRSIEYDWTVTASTPGENQCVEKRVPNILDLTLAATYNIGYTLVKDVWSISGNFILRNPDANHPAKVDTVRLFFQNAAFTVVTSCDYNTLKSLPPGESSTCTFSGSFSSNPGNLHIEIKMLPDSCINGTTSVINIHWKTLNQKDVCVQASTITEQQLATSQGRFCAGTYTSPLDIISTHGNFPLTVTRTSCLTCGRQYVLTQTLVVESQTAPVETKSARVLWCYYVICSPVLICTHDRKYWISTKSTEWPSPYSTSKKWLDDSSGVVYPKGPSSVNPWWSWKDMLEIKNGESLPSQRANNINGIGRKGKVNIKVTDPVCGLYCDLAQEYITAKLNVATFGESVYPKNVIDKVTQAESILKQAKVLEDDGKKLPIQWKEIANELRNYNEGKGGIPVCSSAATPSAIKRQIAALCPPVRISDTNNSQTPAGPNKPEDNSSVNSNAAVSSTFSGSIIPIILCVLFAASME